MAMTSIYYTECGHWGKEETLVEVAEVENGMLNPSVKVNFIRTTREKLC